MFTSLQEPQCVGAAAPASPDPLTVHRQEACGGLRPDGQGVGAGGGAQELQESSF